MDRTQKIYAMFLPFLFKCDLDLGAKDLGLLSDTWSHDGKHYISAKLFQIHQGITKLWTRHDF